MRAIAFLVIVFAASCYALPPGAPASTCQNLMPQHGVAAQPNISSYEIDVSAFVTTNGLYYMPGEYYNITLRAMMPSNATFRGFLIQARAMDGTPVGTFSDPSANQPLTRLSNCEPPEVGVTHNQPGNRTLRVDLKYVTFTWRAPATGMTGSIRFWYTTVQRFTTFWVGETTAVIAEVGGGPTGGATASVTSFGVWALLGTAALAALKISF